MQLLSLTGKNLIRDWYGDSDCLLQCELAWVGGRSGFEW